MYVLWSAALLAVTVLLFSAAYGVFRRPNPAAWTESEVPAMLACLAITSTLTFAIGCLVAFVSMFGSQLAQLTPMHGMIILGMLAAAAVLAPVLSAPARRPEALKPSQTVSAAPEQMPGAPSGLGTLASVA